MKALLLVLLLATGGCTRDPAAVARPSEVVIPVEGMTCSGCEHAIQDSVGKLPGVTHVRASHKEKKAWVRFDAARVQPPRIVEEIVKLGYRASVPAAPR